MRLSNFLQATEPEETLKQGEMTAGSPPFGAYPENPATGLPGGKKRGPGSGLVFPKSPIESKIWKALKAAQESAPGQAPPAGPLFRMVPVQEPAAAQKPAPKPVAQKPAPKPQPQQQGQEPGTDEEQEQGPASKTVANMAVLKHHGFQKWGGGEYLHPKNGSVALNKDDGSWNHKDEQGKNTHKGDGPGDLHEYLNQMEDAKGQDQVPGGTKSVVNADVKIPGTIRMKK